MKITAYVLIGIGILFILFFALADAVGVGRGGPLGAAQLTGIEIGVVFVLAGIGCWRLDAPTRVDIVTRVRSVRENLLASSPTGWVVATFLVLYLALFVTPLLFSKPTIHYFEKYIPDAWVTRIGFDVEQTVTHVQAWLTDGTSPYADGIVPYSPLALALFAPFIMFGYPAYFKLLSLLTVTAFVLGALLLPLWLSRKKDLTLILLFFVIGLVSYGFQFELERGQFNVIAFALALTAIYLFHHYPKFRYFAYLLFSLAVQLKLYPAIFIVMLIEDWRDWKGNLKRVVGLGLFNVALLFVLGADLAGQFVTQIVARQGGFVSSRTEDLSISGFVLQLTTDGFGLLPPAVVTRLAGISGLLSTILLVVFLACLLAMIVHAYRTKQRGLNLYLLAIATLCGLTIPAGSFDYKLPILAAPLALVLGQLPAFESAAKKVAALALTVVMSLAYWLTQYPFTVKPALFTKNFPALFVILLAVTALYFLAGGKSVGETPEV